MVTTEILTVDPKNPSDDILLYAASLIQQGKLVAFPTETVYGLGANALDETAVAKIFAAKGRPADNPLIVHVAEKEAIKKYAHDIPQVAWALTERFWPGPLTLVLEKKEIIPDIVTAGLSTVCLRMPDNTIAKKLIQYAAVPLAAPSANSSTRPSPTTAEHVFDDLAGKVDLILDGGEVEIGLESTVVDITQDPPVILRPGGLAQEELEKVTPIHYLDTTSQTPKAPGMKYRHYSPSVTVVLFEGEHAFQQLLERYNAFQPTQNVKILTTCPIDTVPLDQQIVFPTIEMFAHDLFAEFRKAEQQHIEMLLILGVEKKGVGIALMNRLEKAASEIVQ